MLRLGRAPAKLNLVLELTGRRADGYHQLAGVSQTIAWNDVVGVGPAAPGRPAPEPYQLLICGPHAAGVPRNADNIAVKALLLLRQRGLAGEAGRIVLEKRIPHQSGLGGGSADAAAVIRLLQPAGPTAGVQEVALACGADVPFALLGGAAMIGGVGEELTPLPSLSTGLFLVVVLAAISTAAAYAAVRPQDFSDGSRSAAVAEALRAGRQPDPGLYGSDLLAAATRVSPSLRGRLGELRRATPGVVWSMTGSGGAVFAPVSDPDRAAGIARAATAACPGAIVRAVVAEPPWQLPI